MADGTFKMYYPTTKGHLDKTIIKIPNGEADLSLGDLASPLEMEKRPEGEGEGEGEGEESEGEGEGEGEEGGEGA